jgi:hypothetical protein
MSVENNSFYYIQDIIDKEFREAFRVRMTEAEEAKHFEKELRDCSDKMIEISDVCKTYFKKRFENGSDAMDRSQRIA